MSDSSESSSPRPAASIRPIASAMRALCAGVAERAARPAAAGSIPSRTSVNSISSGREKRRCSIQRSTSGSCRFQNSSAWIQVP